MTPGGCVDDGSHDPVLDVITHTKQAHNNHYAFGRLQVSNGCSQLMVLCCAACKRYICCGLLCIFSARHRWLYFAISIGDALKTLPLSSARPTSSIPQHPLCSIVEGNGLLCEWKWFSSRYCLAAGHQMSIASHVSPKAPFPLSAFGAFIQS